MKPSTPSDERFAALGSKYREPIRRYILSLVRDPAEAEDLTQETFLRAFRKVETLQDETKLSAWLYRIATNICHDRYRQSSRRPGTVPLEAPADDTYGAAEPTLADTSSASLTNLLEQEEMSACVQRYIAELPDSQRGVILLHDLQGMTSLEIGEMLGYSVGAVKIRLHRARAKLKSALRSACDFSTNDRGVFVCEPRPSTPIPLSTISRPDNEKNATGVDLTSEKKGERD